MVESAYQYWGIDPDIVRYGRTCEEELKTVHRRFELIRETNQLRVLQAFQAVGISDSAFSGTTGYGYDDLGRQRLEQAFAQIMGAEASLVRIQISTGTQALAACFYGNLRPGDELLSITGNPYDTLWGVVGIDDPKDKVMSDSGTLKDFNISFRAVDLTTAGEPDWEAVGQAVRPETKLVFIQRSIGYTKRKALSIADIERLVKLIRRQSSEVIIMVDNCYGEFTEVREPTMVGVDLMAGSLIKNPGGGLAPGGAYICGRHDLVERAACRLTAPGIGSEVGPSLGFNRQLLQGLFLAPHVVCEALKGMSFAALVLAKEGFATAPSAFADRGDIVQVIEFGRADDMVHFCQSVQQSAPVDAFVSPIPGPMPGYDSEVIMAAGAFVQGGSLELSADGPLKPPYRVFMQGGLVYEQVKLAVYLTLKERRSPHG